MNIIPTVSVVICYIWILCGNNLHETRSIYRSVDWIEDIVRIPYSTVLLLYNGSCVHGGNISLVVLSKLRLLAPLDPLISGNVMWHTVNQTILNFCFSESSMGTEINLQDYQNAAYVHAVDRCVDSNSILGKTWLKYYAFWNTTRNKLNYSLEFESGWIECKGQVVYCESRPLHIHENQKFKPMFLT